MSGQLILLFTFASSSKYTIVFFACFTIDHPRCSEYSLSDPRNAENFIVEFLRLISLILLRTKTKVLYSPIYS